MSDILVPVQVVLKLFTMANELLGYWVVGNSLTDPGGQGLVESLAVIVERSARVMAWFWSIA
jgi:hypothetical protein